MIDQRSIQDSLDALWPLLSRRAAERTAAASELLETSLLARGPLKRRDQELWAGDLLVNDDRDLLPRLSRATGVGFNVYLGNRRIASFGILDAGGAHEIGGYANAELVDVVLRRGSVFTGTLESAGRQRVLAARPLTPSSSGGEYGALGIVEAFQDVGVLHEVFEGALRQGSEGMNLSSRQLLGDRMKGVGKFIDDVARRLQLLALNGNIIAAQAGDHGRAFRVVCRELGSLADQSKDTAAEVQQLLAQLGEAEPNAAGTDSTPAAADRSTES